ncbi:hypothetical protein AB1Y20_021754 [Prymnesium parvum]|uniref:Uncharacterized protein n=1 Tax=Prymnesium parvum TaxID=97485 RepID=A0AB34JN36_PRYPA
MAVAPPLASPSSPPGRLQRHPRVLPLGSHGFGTLAFALALACAPPLASAVTPPTLPTSPSNNHSLPVPPVTPPPLPGSPPQASPSPACRHLLPPPRAGPPLPLGRTQVPPTPHLHPHDHPADSARAPFSPHPPSPFHGVPAADPLALPPAPSSPLFDRAQVPLSADGVPAADPLALPPAPSSPLFDRAQVPLADGALTPSPPSPPSPFEAAPAAALLALPPPRAPLPCPSPDACEREPRAKHQRKSLGDSPSYSDSDSPPPSPPSPPSPDPSACDRGGPSTLPDDGCLDSDSPLPPSSPPAPPDPSARDHVGPSTLPDNADRARSPSYSPCCSDVDMPPARPELSADPLDGPAWAVDPTPARRPGRQQRDEARSEAERSINYEAQVIALKRKAASWGANETEESITSLSGRWEALANWFGAKVMRDGVMYASAEHAFQAAKAAEPEKAEEIRKAKSPSEAHALGNQLALPRDWERRRVAVMEAVLRDKFRRDQALRERLLKTENKNLIAGNSWGETFWGVSQGSGNNQLGKLLMMLREEIRTGADADAWLKSSFVLADTDSLESLSFDVLKKGEKIESAPLGRLPIIFVGKHSSCTVQLEHPSVSRRHAALLQDKQRGLLLVDLASKAGVTLNGRRLPPSMGIPIKEGASVVFGGSSRTYVLRKQERDTLAALQAQRAALASQIKYLESETNDPNALFGLLPKEKRVDPTKTSVFCGNLSFALTEPELREYLEENGCAPVLSVRFPTDKETGQPRGIAFVEFATPEEASDMVSRLNGEDLLGRELKLDLAKTHRPTAAAPRQSDRSAAPREGSGREAPRGRDREERRDERRERRDEGRDERRHREPMRRRRRSESPERRRRSEPSSGSDERRRRASASPKRSRSPKRRRGSSRSSS